MIYSISEVGKVKKPIFLGDLFMSFKNRIKSPKYLYWLINTNRGYFFASKIKRFKKS